MHVVRGLAAPSRIIVEHVSRDSRGNLLSDRTDALPSWDGSLAEEALKMALSAAAVLVRVGRLGRRVAAQTACQASTYGSRGKGVCVSNKRNRNVSR